MKNTSERRRWAPGEHLAGNLRVRTRGIFNKVPEGCDNAANQEVSTQVYKPLDKLLHPYRSRIG